MCMLRLFWSTALRERRSWTGGRSADIYILDCSIGRHPELLTYTLTLHCISLKQRQAFHVLICAISPPCRPYVDGSHMDHTSVGAHCEWVEAYVEPPESGGHSIVR
jgi:hypothetical protein